MTDYRDYLQSAAWQRVRRCQDCGEHRQLEVHHLTYARIGHEEMSDLRVLCHGCHGERHGFEAIPSGLEPIRSIVDRVVTRLTSHHSGRVA